MRSRFDEQLATLHNNLIEMGAMVEQAITKATRALLEQNVTLADEVRSGDNSIDRKSVV